MHSLGVDMDTMTCGEARHWRLDAMVSGAPMTQASKVIG